MKKLLASFIMFFMAFASTQAFASTPSDANKTDAEKPTTRSDAVIFKIHEVEPTMEEGAVVGCDFTVTLYNRTDVNFRTFTLNLDWKDDVDEMFKFNQYISNYIGKEEADLFSNLVNKDEIASKPLSAMVTVNAFGADKQISVRSHVESEKCYLMLTEASFTVSPCEMVRSNVSTNIGDMSGGKSNCSNMFEFVNTSNPEYFGQFKNISATDEASQQQQQQQEELSSIDEIIGRIVENMGMADKTLANSK